MDGILETEEMRRGAGRVRECIDRSRSMGSLLKVRCLV